MKVRAIIWWLVFSGVWFLTLVGLTSGRLRWLCGFAAALLGYLSLCAFEIWGVRLHQRDLRKRFEAKEEEALTTGTKDAKGGDRVMPEETIVVCNPVSKHPRPVLGSVQRQCARCGCGIWVSGSTQRAIPSMPGGAVLQCGDCAIPVIIREKAERLPITEDQANEVALEICRRSLEARHTKALVSRCDLSERKSR
jgi:hypothetical protein